MFFKPIPKDHLTPKTTVKEQSSAVLPQKEQIISLSTRAAQARALLLKNFKDQLAEPLTSQLKPQEQGVPFIDIDDDPPQVAAIKKVINCLYHAEEALKVWENLDITTYMAMTKSAPQVTAAIRQIYKSLAFLNDATPEIQTIITNNYALFKPIFSGAYELIQSSNWLTQFGSMDVVATANGVLNQGGTLLSKGTPRTNDGNPLILIFTTLTQITDAIANLQHQGLLEVDKQSLLENVRTLLLGLDSIPGLHQLSMQSFEGSKALKSLLTWFSNLEEDGFVFTQQSFDHYIKWTNLYLPEFISLVDELERQNYLKPGLLSKSICQAIDHLGKELEQSTFKPSKVITTSSLIELRKERIDESQVRHVTSLVGIEAQQNAAVRFFEILMNYGGQAFSKIPESVRHELRQLYPDLQLALAHENLELEHLLTAALNEEESHQDNSWTGWVRGYLRYAKGFIVADLVDQVLAKADAIIIFMDKQIKAEKLKFVVAERAREQLIGAEKDDRIEEHISSIRSRLTVTTPKSVVLAGNVTPIDELSLKNLRGNLAYLQNMKLALALHNTRTAFSTLLLFRLPSGYRAFLSTPPYTIDKNKDEPLIVKQIKELENSLYFLEQALIDFEEMDLSKGLVLNYRVYMRIVSAAYQLNSSIQLLSPEVTAYLAPIMKQIIAFGGLSSLTASSSDRSTLDQLKEAGSVAVEEVDKEKSIEKQTETELTLGSYTKLIAKTRASFLAQLQSTLAKPITNRLIPQEYGVPFIELDDDPPQVGAIKKIINSLYYVELALITVQSIQTQSPIAQAAAVHQGMVAMSHLYKSLIYLTEATPEVQSIIRDNYDLLEPIINKSNTLFATSDGYKNIMGDDFSARLGAYFGQGIHGLKLDADESTGKFTIMQFASDLPAVLHAITKQLQTGEEMLDSDLNVSTRKLEALDFILQMVAKDKYSIELFTKGRNAITGLMEILGSLSQESTGVQATTLSAFEKWVNENYPALLSMLDDLETRYYLQPGSLSKAVAEQVDIMSAYFNTYALSFEVDEIHVTPYFTTVRIEILEERRQVLWEELFTLEHQKKTASSFFQLLGRYTNKSSADFSPEDLLSLRQFFSKIQMIMAHGDLELTNSLIQALNQPRNKISTATVMKLQKHVNDYLQEQQRSCYLKIDVINEAIKELGIQEALTEREQSKSEDSSSLMVQVDQRAKTEVIEVPYDEQLNRARQAYEKNQKQDNDPVDLKLIKSSSLTNLRGFLASIQELNLSSNIKKMREQFVELTRNNLSQRAQVYLKKPDDKSTLHVINKEDPLLISEVKEVENNLYYLEMAVGHLERMSKDNSLLAQAKALVEISYQAQQLLATLQSISPQLQEQYGSLMRLMLQVSEKLLSIDYKNKSLRDLQNLAQQLYQDPLEHLKPAASLTTSYMRSASEKVVQAKKYLDERSSQVPEDDFQFRFNMLPKKTKLPRIQKKDTESSMPSKKVYVELARQMTKFERRMGDLGETVKNCVAMKEIAYNEFIIPLSQQEESLYLQPGTLIGPAIAAINDFFLSMALELDIPFDEKMKILDGEHFLSIIINQTGRDLTKAGNELRAEPSNDDLLLQANLKADKIAYLMAELKQAKENSKDAKKNLLDYQYYVYLNKRTTQLTLEEPFLSQFEKSFILSYYQKRDAFLKEKNSSAVLSLWVEEFVTNNSGNYFAVSKCLCMLKNLQKIAAAEKAQNVVDYITTLIQELEDPLSTIEHRAKITQKLPFNPIFTKHISYLSEGASLLARFKQFIEIVFNAVVDAVATGRNIVQVYEQKKTERIIQNIEKTQNFKAEIGSERSDETPESLGIRKLSS